MKPVLSEVDILPLIYKRFGSWNKFFESQGFLFNVEETEDESYFSVQSHMFNASHTEAYKHGAARPHFDAHEHGVYEHSADGEFQWKAATSECQSSFSAEARFPEAVSTSAAHSSTPWPNTVHMEHMAPTAPEENSFFKDGAFDLLCSDLDAFFL
jgi:hypothetical protein